MRKEAVARAGSFAALVLLCATAPAAVATPNITTVAGNGLAGYDGESVAATTAVSSPAAVAADLAGQLLIVDNNQQITRLVDTSGVMTTASGNPGVTGGNCGTGPNVFSDFAALAGPLDVIWGRTLTGAAINGFYLADTNSNCIRIVDMDQFSGSTSFAGNGTGGFSGDGGKPTDAELSGPRGVAQDPTGVMWISDTGNGRIRRVRDNSGTKVIDTVAGCSSSCLGTADDIDPLKAQLSSPQGIASISANQFVFADAGTRRIRKVTLDPADPTLSRITTVAGTGALGSSGDGGPATSARLASPADVAVATGGGLVIADTGNNRIRYVSPGGTISTIAGGGGPGSFSGDGGPADQAFLNTPTSVQPTPDGLLIADLANRRVRRVDATGVTGGTGAFTGSTTANMSFESWDAAAQFECSIDNGAFQTCTSPASFSNLDEGTHLLEVRALDPGGAPDPTPATRSVTVDLTPPAAFGLVAPVDRGFTPAQANFSWESTTDGSSGLDHFELWIDGAKQSDVNLKACSTGTCVGGGDYSEGSHSWQIKAVDAVGNVRSSSVRDFTVDATPPGAALLGTPPDSAFTTGTPTFSWSSVADSGSGVDHYELVIDGSKDSDIAPGACSATCQAPATLGLPLAGTHTWAVRAVDAVGNASESTTRAFTVDSIPPDVFTPAAPADGAVVPGQAVYSWPPANDSLSGVDHYDLVFDAVTGGTSSSQTVQPGTCSVNACSAQVTKAEGDYTWHVTATDGVGNARDTVARSLHVDSTPPDAFLAIAPADAAAVAGTASFSWQATTDAVAGVDHYDLLVDGAPAATVAAGACSGGGCATSLTALPPDGAHTWQVRAVDAVGNERLTSMRGFSLDATSPDAFATTSPAEGARTQNSRPDLSWQASADSGPGGLAGYDVVLDGLTVASPGPATTTFTPATALADGTHDWHVIARDGVGNPRSSGNATFRVDTTAPSARFSIAPNPALVGRTVAFDAGASSDAGGPVTRYEWDLDGDGTFETDTGAIATASRAYALPQTITVQLRVTDALGLTGVGSAELRVTELPVDRNLFGVTVNHGAQFTNTPKVTVTAKFPAATTQILVSNDGGFDAPATFGPQADIPWQLDSSGPERLPKTIYVRFLNGQAISETYQDDIILDEIPPVVQQAAIVPAGAAARVQAAKVRKWAVKLKASDSNSGVDRVQITTNRKKAGKLLAYKRKLTVTSTTRPKYLRARDRAGNFSGWKKIR